MIKINLIAEGKKAVTRKSKAAGAAGPRDFGPFLVLAGLLIGVLAWTGYWMYLKHQIKLRDDVIATDEVELRRLESIIREVEDYKIKKAALEHKINVINELKQNQQGPVRIMDQISRALPELLWLERMDVVGSGVALSGQAFNINAVANFMENLDKVPQFQEPILRDSQQNANAPTYSFQVDFTFNMKPPAKAGDHLEPRGLPAKGAAPNGAGG
jgi:type IV pilus assembly protein PilN